ncbi:hypothetical protein G7009_01300 [Pseudomonas capeferrum]|uniref:hypothetical protein n=1 Tax=Pseudomonas capeferrum TaxID=1495066 RepID=UPI0015E47D1E|nr:hypothetical protein [Pseudomonas capeferrum]MBA1200438.1 hypothetical protein [Pseudomonas capeferrum]
MRKRGVLFWEWIDPALHHRIHDEKLDDGTFIDVQVRLSRTGSTQMFIGIYDGRGVVLHEEAYDARPGETMTRALAWGVGRARKLVVEGLPVSRQNVAASK